MGGRMEGEPDEDRHRSRETAGEPKTVSGVSFVDREKEVSGSRGRPAEFESALRLSHEASRRRRAQGGDSTVGDGRTNGQGPQGPMTKDQGPRTKDQSLPTPHRLQGFPTASFPIGSSLQPQAAQKLAAPPEDSRQSGQTRSCRFDRWPIIKFRM